MHYSKAIIRAKVSVFVFVLLCIMRGVHLRGSVKNNRVDSYLLGRQTYTSEIWHMNAINCPVSEYAIYKTMQSVDCCCLATEECEITSCVHAGI